jgi:hypothetical protein
MVIVIVFFDGETFEVVLGCDGGGAQANMMVVYIYHISNLSKADDI